MKVRYFSIFPIVLTLSLFHAIASAQTLVQPFKAVVEEVNLEQQRLIIDGQRFLLTTETQAFSYTRAPISIDSLSKGMVVEVLFKNTEPYPTITQIRILSNLLKEDILQ